MSALSWPRDGRRQCSRCRRLSCKTWPLKHLEDLTNTANRYLHAAHEEAEAGEVPVEDLLDRALASMEHLREAVETMTRLLDELLET